MLLAELNIRHTRRHMPTRRVAVDDGYLPTSGPAFGGVLIGAVIAEHVPGLDEEQLDALAPPGRRARATASPCRASRCGTGSRPTPTGSTSPGTASPAPTSRPGSLRPILELDRHGPPAPQVIGALMAASRAPAVGPPHRVPLRRRRASPAPACCPRASRSGACTRACPGCGPPRPGAAHRARRSAASTGRRVARACRRSGGGRWRCSGSTPACTIERDDVQRRFRRLVRLAHPDHGASSAGAAERIAELAEARELLLGRRRLGGLRLRVLAGAEPAPR